MKNQHNSGMEDYAIGVTVYYDTPKLQKTGFYKAKYRVAPIGKKLPQMGIR